MQFPTLAGAWLGAYYVVLLLLAVYGIHRLVIVALYQFGRSSAPGDLNTMKEWPQVTVQLPLFNELYVAERLLKAAADIDYPAECLEIQVLDDSTDGTYGIVARTVAELRRGGVAINHLHRTDRQGFKAGALASGLSSARGEFICVFDADFLPPRDLLKRSLPHFGSPEVGMVQARWTHLNRDYSLLTKIQAFALDFHFILEQTGRNFGRHFINFNGTAGIWRKECILDAGNWSGETLTEDLDLSYRAQLKKWKFKYLEDVETPAELPVVISAARSQQFRWNKGAAENFRKNYRKLVKDPSVSFGTKFHGFFHLLNSSMFLIVLLLGILSVPVLYIKNNNPMFSWYFNVLAGFGISTIIFFFCYYVPYTKIYGKGIKSFFNFIGMFITFYLKAYGVGASLVWLESAAFQSLICWIMSTSVF